MIVSNLRTKIEIATSSTFGELLAMTFWGRCGHLPPTYRIRTFPHPKGTVEKPMSRHRERSHERRSGRSVAISTLCYQASLRLPRRFPPWRKTPRNDFINKPQGVRHQSGLLAMTLVDSVRKGFLTARLNINRGERIMDNQFPFLDNRTKEIVFESDQISEKRIISIPQESNSCPDCLVRLVRLGNCFSCPLCGYGGCS